MANNHIGKVKPGTTKFRLRDVTADFAAGRLPEELKHLAPTPPASAPQARWNGHEWVSVATGAPMTNNAGGSPLDPNGVTSATR